MKTKIKVMLCFVLMMLGCAGCTVRKEIPETAESIQEQTVKPVIELSEKRDETFVLDSMTLEEKVAQLFIVLPESLMEGVDCVTAAGDMTKEAIHDTPIGGFIYLNQNLKSEEQVKTMLDNVQSYSIERIGIPAFLCVDEEGGTVTRVSATGKFNVPDIEDMSMIGQNQDLTRAKEVGKTIGGYLTELGFNVDFAPVADVLSNPDNEVVKLRSFGSDAKMVSDMSLAFMEGLQENKVYAAYKHFPGHGSTAADTHEGYAYTDKTLEELETCELIPFQKGIEAEVPFIMVGHISLPEIIGDNTPASLSKTIMTDLLRNKMGYEGIIITDAMNMGAIVQQYSSADAAVKAFLGGADIILMPEDFRAAYKGIIEAVNDGIISEERIDESVERILRLKMKNSD